jgi:hypothetical protein
VCEEGRTTPVIERGASMPLASTKTLESLACREPWSLSAWNLRETSPNV